MKIRATLFVLCLGLALLAGCSSNKKQIAAQEQQIADLQGQVTQLQSDLETEKKKSADLNSELETALADYQKKEQVLLEKIDDKSVITVSDAMMFKSGGVNLTDKAKEILDKIGEVLNRYPDREIRIAGHTDNVNIGLEFQGRFKSNWELSTARATSVLHFMTSKYHIEPNRIAAVGYGEYRPIGDNSTAEGRASNRRVVIEVGPKL